MKPVIALTASLAVANAALLPRQLEDIPTCALNCALTSLGSTGCSTSDFACICKATLFIESLVPCVQDACTDDEYAATLAAASSLCQSAGVSLSVPAGASSTAATSAASSSSAASSASTTEAATTTAASAESSAATTSAASSAESSSEAMTSAASTTAAATTAGGNGTVSTTSPPSPTGSPGAASRNTIALGGLGAIVALVAAFL